MPPAPRSATDQEPRDRRAPERVDPERVAIGRAFPLGASCDATGTNFAVFAGAAEHVEVCLLDDGHETRVGLPGSTAGVWHGHLPGVGAGQRYGLRAHGPWDPAGGRMYNPAKLLLDPYARAVEGDLLLDDAIFGCHGHDRRQRDARDSAGHVPAGLVLADGGGASPADRPGTPWDRTVVYELHVKGFTARHPGVPAELRGTYAGLAHPAAVEYLVDLGVTTVELLPVQQFVSEPAVLRRGQRNYWGYNTIGFFAPHKAYAADQAPGAQVAEFRDMVRALHAAGLEVLLDVVYNHSGEGDADGPTLSFRGLDNAAYYRLDHHAGHRYVDVTGCGNTLDIRHPQVSRLVLDSLRYWVTAMGVDGFRFDLATTLGRSTDGVDLHGGFFAAVAADPVLSGVKLVAESWDIGTDGYRLGGFPPPWGEWNGRYRDTVRDFWRGAGPVVGELGCRLAASSDLFHQPGRTPSASVNFVTAHDGFTLADLVAYDRKHNEDNGEHNADGTTDNRSWNCGVEGPTDDPAVLALRRRQVRNLLATLLLSAGVPMISAGDERGRTQNGNNNPYCRDEELSWLSWETGADADGLRAFVARLLRLRRDHPVLRPAQFLRGRPARPGGNPDLAWFTPAGVEMTSRDWAEPTACTLGMYLCGDAAGSGGGAAPDDDSFLVLLHAGAEAVEFVLPAGRWASSYEVLVDTAREPSTGLDGPAPDGPDRPDRRLAPGTALHLAGRSLVLARASR